MRSSNKTTLYLGLGVLVILVAFFAYRFWLAAPAPEPGGLVAINSSGLVAGSGGVADDEFLRLLLSLQAIDLTSAGRVIPLLSGLTDFSTVLQPQTPGRPNPFAPLGL